jgi:hypothetical protein
MKITLRRFPPVASLLGLLSLCCLWPTVSHAAPVAMDATAPQFETITADAAERLLGGATPITIHLRDATVQTVLNELTRQTGVKFTLTAPSARQQAMDAKVTIDVDRQPFWVATQSVLAQAKLRFSSMIDSNHIALAVPDVYPREAMPVNAPLVTHGPVTIALSQVHAARGTTVLLAQPEHPQTQNSLLVVGRFTMDPRLMLLNYPQSLHIEEAVDEKGNSLVAGQRAQAAWANGSSNGGELKIGLDNPPNRGKTLARLKGTFVFTAATRWTHWEVPVTNQRDNIVKTIAMQQGDVTYTMRGVKPYDNLYELVLAVNGPKFVTDRVGSTLTQQVRLEDAARHALPQRSSSGSLEGATYLLTEKFSNQNAADMVGEPTTVVVNLPTEIKNIEVPFEFTNLPLP